MERTFSTRRKRIKENIEDSSSIQRTATLGSLSSNKKLIDYEYKKNQQDLIKNTLKELNKEKKQIQNVVKDSIAIKENINAKNKLEK